MRKIVVSEFVSLDGVMQAPGGVDEDTDGGFKHGGWTGPYWHDDIGANFMQEMTKCDTFLLGRKTWQTHGEAFEPMPAGDPFGNVMNNMHKVVVSTKLKSAAAWRNSTLISQNVVDEIRKLKQKPGKDIYVDGSSVLVHTLAQNDLVDEYSLLVFPVVLGGGKRLFGEGTNPSGFKLLDSKISSTGVIIATYQQNGELKTGTF